MSAKVQKLEKILNELESGSEIITTALVNMRGQLMASGAQMKTMDEKALGAMSAALTSVGSRVSTTLECGETESIVITGTDRMIIVKSLSSSVLISVASADSKVGLLEFEIEKTLNDLKDLLG